MPDQPSPSCATLGQAEDFVRGLYWGLLGREPDNTGLQHWMKTLKATGDPAAVLNGITSSAEYSQKSAAHDARRQMKKAIAERVGTMFRHRPLIIVDVGA